MAAKICEFRVEGLPVANECPPLAAVFLTDGNSVWYRSVRGVIWILRTPEHSFILIPLGDEILPDLTELEEEDVDENLLHLTEAVDTIEARSTPKGHYMYRGWYFWYDGEETSWVFYERDGSVQVQRCVGPPPLGSLPVCRSKVPNQFVQHDVVVEL